MQDPERLLNGGTDFERTLLRGGAAERPSTRVVRRMALGAGVGGALSYSSSAKALMQTWWGKTVTIAVVGGGVAVGVAGVLTPGAAPERLTHNTAQKPAPAAEVAQAEELRASEPAPPAEEQIEARPLAKPVAPKALPRSVKPASTLADEIKLLDRVRALMAAGDRTAALRELDGYDRRYADGTLRREARVLRARASGMR